jgi:hypothetical protein
VVGKRVGGAKTKRTKDGRLHAGSDGEGPQSRGLECHASMTGESAGDIVRDL